MLLATVSDELTCRNEIAEEILLRMMVKRKEADDLALVTFTLVPRFVKVSIEGGKGSGHV